MIQSDYKLLVKSFFLRDPKTVMAVIGHPGIGKTVIPKQVAMEAGVPCVVFNMAEEHPDDICGIPRVVNDQLVYMLDPRWDTIFNNPAGIIVWDEYNRGHVEVQQLTFSAMEESKRIMRGHKIPDGWLQILTMNPDNGVYHVNSPDPAGMDRFCPINLEADQQAWTTWAEAEKLSETVIMFAKLHWEMISCDPTKVAAGESFPSPRSWETVSRWEKVDLFNPLNPNTQMEEMLIGKVGPHAARQYLSACRDKYVRFVTAKEIFETPLFTEDKDLQKRFFSQQKAGKNDRINASLRDIGDYVIKICESGADKIPDTVETQLIPLIADARLEVMNMAALVKRIHKHKQVAEMMNKPEHKKLSDSIIKAMRANMKKAE